MLCSGYGGNRVPYSLFFIRSNPLTIPGVEPGSADWLIFEGLLHWFTSIARVGFLLMPLAYSFLGVIPLQVDGAELLYFFLPFYLVAVKCLFVA